MNIAHKGDLVEVDGLIAVVVATDNDSNVPEDHVGLWFGVPSTKRISEGGVGGESPEVFTVPIAYCSPIANLNYIH